MSRVYVVDNTGANVEVRTNRGASVVIQVRLRPSGSTEDLDLTDKDIISHVYHDTGVLLLPFEIQAGLIIYTFTPGITRFVPPVCRYISSASDRITGAVDPLIEGRCFIGAKV